MIVQEHLDPALDISTVAAPQLATLADVALASLSKNPSDRSVHQNHTNLEGSARRHCNDIHAMRPGNCSLLTQSILKSHLWLRIIMGHELVIN